jgi:hypothetical protein
MATTRTRSTPSSNGSAAHSALERAKGAGSSVTTAARKAKGPMLAAGATAAGLAGGLALGSRMTSKRAGLGARLRPRRTVLGVPVGRRSGLIKSAQALGTVASEMSSARHQASVATDDIHQIREHLERESRRSPIEVVLDGLTHRPGTRKR